MDERSYWLAFSAFPGVGPARFQTLLKHFGTAKNAWSATRPDLVKAGIGEKLTEKFERFKTDFSVQGYAKKLKEKKDTDFLILTDPNYPKLLKETKSAPFVLYIKGTLSEQSILGVQPLIAVVGTRKITNYGRDVTRMLVADLVGQGFTIVSGLALGVDAVAHETAIEAGGKTIAVLGSGVDVCHPQTNFSLYKSIIGGNGAVVSEFPVGQTPTIGSFPSRNRIIAGLSAGVLVTEGAEDSGALITADYAFQNNRPVFAVPGPITSSLSRGPHKLLAKGAKMVTNAQDILREFKMQNAKVKITTKNSKLNNASKAEQKILKILEAGEVHIDEIVRKSGMNTASVGSLLSVMQMKGLVRDAGGGVFGVNHGL